MSPLVTDRIALAVILLTVSHTPIGRQGGLDKKFLLSQQFKYSMRLFEAKNVSFC